VSCRLPITNPLPRGNLAKRPRHSSSRPAISIGLAWGADSENAVRVPHRNVLRSSIISAVLAWWELRKWIGAGEPASAPPMFVKLNPHASFPWHNTRSNCRWLMRSERPQPSSQIDDDAAEMNKWIRVVERAKRESCRSLLIVSLAISVTSWPRAGSARAASSFSRGKLSHISVSRAPPSWRNRRFACDSQMRILDAPSMRQWTRISAASSIWSRVPASHCSPTKGSSFGEESACCRLHVVEASLFLPGIPEFPSRWAFSRTMESHLPEQPKSHAPSWVAGKWTLRCLSPSFRKILSAVRISRATADADWHLQNNDWNPSAISFRSWQPNAADQRLNSEKFRSRGNPSISLSLSLSLSFNYSPTNYSSKKPAPRRHRGWRQTPLSFLVLIAATYTRTQIIARGPRLGHDRVSDVPCRYQGEGSRGLGRFCGRRAN